MTVAAVMISCADREAIRIETLRSLVESDYGDGPIHVEFDHTRFERRQARQEHTALAALERGQGIDAEFLLFLEDDLVFNRHFRHNLESWAPLCRREVALASLYNPGLPALDRCAAENWMTVAPHVVFGSQAFLLSADFASLCIRHWWEIPGMQDVKMSRLAARFGKRMYYHSPSLVQHRPGPSVWGGLRHQAADFDKEWRASSFMPARS